MGACSACQWVVNETKNAVVLVQDTLSRVYAIRFKDHYARITSTSRANTRPRFTCTYFTSPWLTCSCFASTVSHWFARRRNRQLRLVDKLGGRVIGTENIKLGIWVRFQKEFVYCTCPGRDEEMMTYRERTGARAIEGAHVHGKQNPIVNAPFIGINGNTQRFSVFGLGRRSQSRSTRNGSANTENMLQLN